MLRLAFAAGTRVHGRAGSATKKLRWFPSGRLFTRKCLSTEVSSSASGKAKPPPLPMSPFGAAPPKLRSKTEKKSLMRFRTPAIMALLVGAIGGYFYKGNVEKKNVQRLHERLQRRPISPQEIEDLRLGNKIKCNDLIKVYKQVDAAAQPAQHQGERARVDASALSNILIEAVKPENAPPTWTLANRHDFERLCQWLVETEFLEKVTGQQHAADGISSTSGTMRRQVDGKINTDVAKVALSLFARDSGDERLRFLLRTFSSDSQRRDLVGTGSVAELTAAKSGNSTEQGSESEAPSEVISRDELLRLVTALVRTFQLDYKSQTIEKKAPRFQVWTPSSFEIATPEQLLDKAVGAYAEAVAADVEKARKKGLDVPVPKDSNGKPLSGDKPDEVRAAIQAKQEFTFGEARGFLFGRAICVWGQCHSNVSRSRRRNSANIEREGVNEFDSTAASSFDADEAIAAADKWQKVPLAPDAPSFIAATSFEGSKPGYIFTSGSQGVGYYEDQGPEGHA